MKFDDMKRRVIRHPKPMYLNKVITAQLGTPEYDAYLSAYMLAENTTLEMCVEDDGKTATFYTVVTDPKKIKEYQDRKVTQDNERNERNGSSSAFV